MLEIENELLNYNFKKEMINQLSIEIDNRKSLFDIKSPKFSEYTGGMSNITEIDYINEMMSKEIKRTRLVEQVTNLDIKLSQLTDNEREVIKKRYFKGQQFKKIAIDMIYTERQVNRFKVSALKKLSKMSD